MRLGRVLRIAALAVWATAVTYYWWHFVPAEPNHILPLKGRSHRWTKGFGDVIVLCQNGPGEGRSIGLRSERTPPTVGPLQFYDPATGELLRQVLTADDEILALELKPRAVAIVFRDNIVHAVDLSNPENSVALQGVDPNSEFTFADGAKIVIDDNDGRETTLDLETGAKADPAARHTGAHRGSIAFSEDERRYARMVVSRALVIYDAATDGEICRLPFDRLPAHVQFTPDGSKLMVLEDINPPRRRITVWDLETRQKLSRQPGHSLPRGHLSRNGAWIISSEHVRSPLDVLVRKLPASATSRLQRSTILQRLLAPSDPQYVLTDSFTGRIVGRYRNPDGGIWLVVPDDQRGAIALGDHGAIHCYRVPADRNWLWLIKWGAVPIAAGSSMMIVFRKLRRHQLPLAGPRTAAPSQS